MSDVQVQPGWWQASDGKWYPPERHPEYRPQGLPPLPQDSGLQEPSQPPIPPTMQPPFAQDPGQRAQVQQPAMTAVLPQQPSRQMLQAERAATTESVLRVGVQVTVTRRFRMRRLPCGHCSAPLPRFIAFAPSRVSCPNCANGNQVMEGWLFRRGYPLGGSDPR